jgi:hypothetical protein
MSTILAPRSLVLLVGLPSTIGFASTPDSSARVGLGTESAGASCTWTRPDLSGYPTNACSLIGTDIKPITDPFEWCGRRKTQDDCMPPLPAMVVKQSAGSVYSFGEAVNYDICVWDSCNGKCRLAEWTYPCAVTCPGVPPGVPRGASVSDIELQADCSLKSVPSNGEFTSSGGITYTTAYTCVPRLVDTSRRQLLAEPSLEKNRRLQVSCPTMSNGNVCCEVVDAPVSNPFQTDPNDPALSQAFETCTFIPGISEDGVTLPDVCECKSSTVELGQENPACPDTSPFPWGTNGAGRRQ